MCLLMVGLDKAGNAIILYKRKLAEVVATVPIPGFHLEAIGENSIVFTVRDVATRSSYCCTNTSRTLKVSFGS